MQVIEIADIVQTIRLTQEDAQEENRREPRSYLIKIITESTIYEFGTSLRSDAEKWCRSLQAAVDTITWHHFFSREAYKPEEAISGYMGRKSCKSQVNHLFFIY